jgi:alanyl-tRNA synthetase
MRLDFSWQQALSAATRSEIEEVSNLAIRGDLAVSAQFMSLTQAKEWGAVALFGETYDDSVRVVQIGGPWSRELCGGTHVSRSSQIGLVSVIGESSVGSGSRRLEAFVGIEAIRALNSERALVSRLVEGLKLPKEQLEERILANVEELRAAQKRLSAMQSANLAELVPTAIANATVVNGTRVVEVALGEIDDANDLRTLAFNARDRVGSDRAVVIVTAKSADKPLVGVATTQSSREAGLKAGALVRIAATLLGGGGGGKDDFAQGGGADSSKLAEAVSAIKSAI